MLEKLQLTTKSRTAQFALEHMCLYIAGSAIAVHGVRVYPAAVLSRRASLRLLLQFAWYPLLVRQRPLRPRTWGRVLAALCRHVHVIFTFHVYELLFHVMRDSFERLQRRVHRRGVWFWDRLYGVSVDGRQGLQM